MEFKSSALVLNARQILAQFLKKKLMIEETTFNWLYKAYNGISSRWDEELQKIHSHLENKSFDEAVS